MERYRVEAKLGAGGMAEVFIARQIGAEGFSRRVALKKVLPHFSNDAHFAHMFVTEARIAAGLNHPNIVQVLDFDRDETGCLFLAMEFIDGCDLSKLAEVARHRGAPFDPGIVAFAIGEVFRALDYAHTLTIDGQWLGIVHRDVSPHNVLVARSGAVKLGDFGIAKATAASTHSGTIKGKIAYMSPEQASGLQVDGRTDLFAMGVMLYELLCGIRPFGGQTDVETIAQILSGSYPPIRHRVPRIGADLEEIVNRLLRPSRDQRFSTAAEALSAIVDCECYPADGTTQMARIVRTVLDTADAPQMTPRPSRVHRHVAVGTATRTGSVVRVGKGRLVALWSAARTPRSPHPMPRRRPSGTPGHPSTSGSLSFPRSCSTPPHPPMLLRPMPLPLLRMPRSRKATAGSRSKPSLGPR
jgi:serine/threonine-protein kinase